MKRTDWLKKKRHAAETIHTDTGDLSCVIHDAEGRQQEGFGKTEELAFANAHGKHLAALKRAAHTVGRYKLSTFTGKIGEVP